jgi:hypothetical protein
MQQGLVTAAERGRQNLLTAGTMTFCGKLRSDTAQVLILMLQTYEEMIFYHRKTVIKGLRWVEGGRGQVSAKLTEKSILEMKKKYCLCSTIFKILIKITGIK